LVAATGITGGFSPGLVFGPVVGTLAGTLGVGGRGEADVRGRVAVSDGPTGMVVRDPSAEVVQPATASSAKTANPPIRRMAQMIATN
jgi:hypothetical protein